ncbi:secreted protein [Deinococcus marmoris]|uniref:Secreted protein n=1 Tax=Deinococcus marmoris TaxID=249408 RepID=A0A1U7P4B1_9DEIO|nr:secreted protein [Deinococcus marmoris]
MLSLTATGKGYAGLGAVQAGHVQVNLKNASKTVVDIGFFRLRPGVTDAQFKAALLPVLMPTPQARDADYKLSKIADVLGGTVNALPGGSVSAVLHLTPGRYIIASTFIDETTHKAALSEGYFQPLTVTGPLLNNPPKPADYALKMVDYRFELPARVTPGTHTWHLSNSGQELHFAVIAKLLPGKTIKDVTMGGDGAGPPPLDFEHAVFSPALTSGQAQDLSLNLSAGTYAVMCFVRSKSGVEHAQMGMVQELRVK